MQDTIVVAGGGHAAAQVVDSLRRDGYAGRLVMACGEPSLPYQRPPLSKKFLGGELDVERLPIRHDAYYESIHCELVLGNPVVAIDAGARKVKLSDGGSLAYDKLVLAIGGHARPMPVPGADLPGVHVLRTMADVEAIRARIQPGVRVAVVGAGYIGLECAATFRKLGLDVTVIEMMDRVMNRVVAPEMSNFYHSEHAGHGVNVLTERKVQGLPRRRQRPRRRVHGRHARARGPRDRRHRAGAELRARRRPRASSATTASPSTSIAAPATRTSTRSATAAATRARATAGASASSRWTTPSSRRSPRPRTSAARRRRTTRRRGSGRTSTS